MESLEEIARNKGFHCAHLNIRSLPNKHDILRQTDERCNNNLHVLGLSATWLFSSTPDSFINFNEYTCVRNDRTWGNPDIPNHVKKGGWSLPLY